MSNTYTLEVIPKPDDVNRNNIYYRKTDLDWALKCYQAVIDKGNAFVVLGYPAYDTDLGYGGIKLDDIIATIKSIKYNEELNSYIAEIEFNNNIYHSAIIDMIKHDVSNYRLALNKIGQVKDNIAHSLKISNCSIVPLDE
jgi:hypothetical protein